ncbi:ATP-binding protein [Argonema antarcticum]|uniref:ATP-binding protein n=1 Tax=Argonema antarcticum TaxID=2942763 RepID=UPI00201241FB|nr:ATP-binding protein [Argonema antarcticum]MCL1469694.1 ATP-binding protein [Argonema antarcticum A004/B2]
MATIDDVIKQSLNPFDNFAARNFWEKPKPAPTIESIHQEPLRQIKKALDDVTQDRETRTLILYGDAGSGKTHFLGRLKETLNNQAFFAYIEPFPQSDYIWRHILRYTVDSLVNAPAGQTDSQLILWLKSCFSAIEDALPSEQKNLIDKVKNFFVKPKDDARADRQLFIDILRKTIGTKGFYNANEFFGVLYNLTNPELSSLACEWLKGDDLDEEDLKKLQVKNSIDSEEKARGILGNFSKISAQTQPIVLCFDNIDSIARLDGAIDIQALFSVTSAIYNANWQGLLIIISVITSTWNDNYKRVQPADLHRITIKIPLKRITLDEAEALLATRLAPLHEEARPKPNSTIYPVTKEDLEKEFPGKKALPRNVLMLGQQIFQTYKKGIIDKNNNGGGKGEDDKVLAALKLIWQDEYKKAQVKIIKITLLAVPELIRMLAEALAALQFQGIKPKLLSGKYASYSLSYQQPGQQKRIGIVWTEDPSMNSFVHLMNACQKVIQQNACENLYLIRAVTVGNARLAGYQIYQQIFTASQHRHIKATLSSVHYLAAYHSLVNSALANELVVAGKTVSLKELEALIRDAEILNNCSLLKELGIVQKTDISTDQNLDFKDVREFLLNVVQTQGYLSKNTLNKNAIGKFFDVNKTQVEQLIQQLIKENKIQLVNPSDPPNDHLVCFVPKV